MVDTVREPLIVLDKDLWVIAASRSFYVKFATNPDNSRGRHLYELGNGEWDIPRLRELLESIIPDHGTMDDYEVEQDFPNVGKRVKALAKQLDSQVVTSSGPKGTTVSVTHATFAGGEDR